MERKQNDVVKNKPYLFQVASYLLSMRSNEILKVMFLLNLGRIIVYIFLKLEGKKRSL